MAGTGTRPPNPRIGWREGLQAWVIKRDQDPAFRYTDLFTKIRPDGFTLRDYLVAFQVGGLINMPDGPEKERRRVAIDALRANAIYVEDRQGPPRGAWELIYDAGAH